MVARTALGTENAVIFQRLLRAFKDYLRLPGSRKLRAACVAKARERAHLIGTVRTLHLRNLIWVFHLALHKDIAGWYNVTAADDHVLEPPQVPVLQYVRDNSYRQR